MKDKQYQYAVYQFIADHSKKHGVDMKCTFVYSSKKNLLDRIGARYKGYATSNIKEQELKAKNEMLLFKNLVRDNALRSQYLNPSSHNIYGKVILFINRWAEKQLKQQISKKI